ncbi:hypothetical protein NIES4073_40920 [Kalymmatonema gypsitolerans NIES-4073]|nr:hypothetical protein NIES4073_40920 [Scytonema sp. NIES-4073]
MGDRVHILWTQPRSHAIAQGFDGEISGLSELTELRTALSVRLISRRSPNGVVSGKANRHNQCICPAYL